MPKFFVNNNQINNNNVIINGEDVNHIANVLRMKSGDKIQICDTDTSNNYIVELQEFSKKEISAIILEKISSEAEANVNINIFQGIPKSDKMELIIQKSTELGAKELTPVDMERCVSKINKKDESKKIERWQKIAEVAAKQSGRDIIPKINNIVKINDICENISKLDFVIVPYEKEEQNNFKNTIELIKNKYENTEKEKVSIGIVIGPEGGFDSNEIEKLKNAGAQIITLGKRILRTETVALAMVSIIMYEIGGAI